MSTLLDQKTTKIFIVDDHALVREGLRTLIDRQSDMEVCGEAAGAAEALQLLREAQPDIAIVDLSLADGSGLELIKDIRRRNGDVRILVSSMHDEKLFAERAIEAGAMGYVHKQESSRTIITAIDRVREGKLYLSDETAQRMLTRAAREKPEATKTPIETFTNRELEVFEMLGRGKSAKQIAAVLHLSPKTVDRYRENIKHKLRVESSSDVLRAATQWVLEQK